VLCYSPVLGIDLDFSNCFLVCFRTPMMAAMHEDDSPDLREVARILNDILEVNKSDMTPYILSSNPVKSNNHS